VILGAPTPAASSSSAVNADLVALLSLGALALLIFAFVYLKEKKVSATFARIFGLVVVAILGVGLGFSNLTDAARTAGFTLLGTIAGYLAGAKTQTAPTAPGAAAGALGPPPPAAPPAAPGGPVDTFL